MSRWHPDENHGTRVIVILVVTGLLLVAGVELIILGVNRETLAVAAGLGIVAFGVTSVYRAVIRRVLRRDDLGDRPVVDGLREQDVQEAMADFHGVSVSSAARFLLLIAEPRTVVFRLTETLTPTNRSTEIVSVIEMDVEGDEGDEHVLPLVRRRRSSLDSGTSVTDYAGHLAPILPKEDVIAYTLLSTRSVIGSISDSVLELFTSQMEASLLTALCSPPASGPIAVLDEIAALSPGNTRLRSVLQALRLVALYDFTCIAVTLPPASRSHATTLKRAARSSRPLRMTVRRRDVLVYDSPSTRSRRIVAGLRSTFGIPVSTIFVRLDDAARARSYHAELVGPEHSFLARQTMYRGETPDRPRRGDSVGLRRFGQRHAHLYLHAPDGLNGWRYAATFYERMPSSLAPVAVSSLVLVALLALASFTLVLGRGTDLVGHPAFAATLLGVPSAISIWSGLHRSRTGSSASGGLFPLLGTLTTILLAIAGVVINVDFGDDLRAWSVLTWVAVVNSALLVGAWSSRAHFVHRLQYRDTDITAPD